MASYDYVVLTEDEMIEGLIEAKRLKLRRMELVKIKEIEESNRKLKTMKWDFDVIKGFMIKRAESIFNGKFILDDNNADLFDLMCYYFIDDADGFVMQAKKMDVSNPSITKGNFVCGNFGCGKTWLMLLFGRNKKQSFDVVRSKQIADAYLTSDDKKIPEMFLKPFDAQDQKHNRGYVSSEIFYQRYIGLCIDDLGSEEEKNNFGNKMNVVGDLIEQWYAGGYTGLFLHATTNLTADQLKNFYGERVISRMREIFNFIELPGNDRRK